MWKRIGSINGYAFFERFELHTGRWYYNVTTGQTPENGGGYLSLEYLFTAKNIPLSKKYLLDL